MFFSDFHVHTSFSSDCNTPMEDMINKAISLGMKMICFTDHLDLDFIHLTLPFTFDVDDFFETFDFLKNKYSKKIKILSGVELGLQPHLGNRQTELLSKYPFDFVIGSSHMSGGLDPYLPEFYENRTEDEAYRFYFEHITENIKAFSGFSVYGHLDYVVRYGPNRNKMYSYRKFSDVIDTALRNLIERGKGIELNTSGLRYGLGQFHPHSDVIKRYKELGGEIITLGSDSHRQEDLCCDFDSARELLIAAGFKYHTVFENMKPEFIKL